MKLNVNRKLQIPNLFYILLLAAMVLFYFIVDQSVERLVGEQKAFNELSGAIRNTVNLAKDYTNGDSSFEDMVKNIQSLAVTLKDVGKDAGEADELQKSIEKYETLHQDNIKIENELVKLTSDSIKISNDFIGQMSQKLADEKTRASVSTLERLVIQGANVNTSSNYELRLLFNKLKEDINAEQELLGFIDKILKNVEKDAEALAGTPFEGLAQTAKKINTRIKELTLSYADNVKKMSALKRELLLTMENRLKDLDMENSRRNEAFFNRIKRFFQGFVLLFLIGCIVGISITWYISRGISKPIKTISNGARKLSIGDIALTGMNFEEINRINDRTDELGEIGLAFKSLIDYMKEKTSVTAKIADGDLTSTVRPACDEDQLGYSLHKMLKDLSHIISQVSASSSQVDAGSRQVSDSSQSLSQGATEQAASLEQITSSLTELGSQTKNNAENATRANQLGLEVRETAENGTRQMGEMVQAIGDISSSGTAIAKIIKTIDDIAFQTNLLALNAAVEAARAGKHGKGFAVVASEVRNLAGKSAKAAQETAELIDNSVKKMENGTTIAARMEEMLSQIVEGVVKMSDYMEDIAVSSNEQALGISQVNQGLGQIESVTQMNTANAEETASAAEELSSQALAMRDLMSRFRVTASDSGRYATQPVTQPEYIEDMEYRSEEDEMEWGGKTS